jgi:hypothetical protein
MLSRTYAMEPEKPPSTDSGDIESEALDTELLIDMVPSWLGMGVVGALLMIVGFFFLSVSSTVGGGVLIIGILMLAGARLAWKWDIDDTAISDLDYQLQQEFGSQTVDDEFQDMTTARQKEIEEIVKAVKSTIRVRCRYCGTLNEEKANNCESCGANL